MPTVKAQLRKLVEYALAKPGVERSRYGSKNIYSKPHLQVPHCSWGDVMEWREKVLHVPVKKVQLVDYQTSHPEIVESEWMPRDGHTYLVIPLSLDVTWEFLTGLVDHAYEIIWKKVDKNGKWLIGLAGQPYNERACLDALLNYHKLEDYRNGIYGLLRPTVFFLTSPGTKAKPGTSRVGGLPDLPAKAKWPTEKAGRPLTFLCQIDLAELAEVGSPFPALPKSGLLSVFSLWGWMDPDEGDPKAIDLPGGLKEKENGWTQCVFTPADTALTSHTAPDETSTYKPAAAKLVAMRTLPLDVKEPPVAELGVDEELTEKFDQLFMDFREIQLKHLSTVFPGTECKHLLGGYAHWEQGFPEEFQKANRTMFLQIGSDDYAQMMWGDGGQLTFAVDGKALGKGRIEKVAVEYQCG